MEGIKEAIAYIVNPANKAETPQVVEIDGKTYCNKEMVRYDKKKKANPITATTLTSLVDYIRDNQNELREQMIIHVESPTEVSLYSGLLEERDRETLFYARAMMPSFSWGHEYGQEAFLVSMQACFLPTEDRDAVTALASNIVNTQQATYSDDGVSQQAVIKTGITTKDNALVPNPVKLIPYRTFLEVEQPASDFVFRVGESRGEPTFKLTEADGGRWKLDAMANIKMYLEAALENIQCEKKITVIA